MTKRLIILQDERVNPIVGKQAYHMTCIASAWLHTSRPREQRHCWERGQSGACKGL